MVEVKAQQDEEVWYLFPLREIETFRWNGNLHLSVRSFSQNGNMLLEAEVSQAYSGGLAISDKPKQITRIDHQQDK